MGHTAVQRGKLYPVDEGSKDSSFKAFREKLLEAARKRDKQFIVSILDPKIQNSFGSDGGLKEFQERWKLDSPDSELWNTLITILSLGGSFVASEGEMTFCAPYVFSRWPHNFDSFKYAAITGKNVRLRMQPNSTAPVVITLSYDIVKTDYEESMPEKAGSDSYTWVRVTTLTGTKGYISGKYVRSPIDYRACFSKANGKWVMTVLVAGD